MSRLYPPSDELLRGQQMAMMNMEKYKYSNKVCCVCGGNDARMSYGAIVCPSCRIFFIRTANRKSQIICKKSNKCIITTNARLNCSSCRLQKCIDVNMNLEDVGKRNKKSHVVNYLSSFHYNQRRSEINLCLLPWGLKVITRLENASTAMQYAHILLHFDSLVINTNGKSPSEVPANLNVPLGEALLNPSLISSREAAGWDSISISNSQKPYFVEHTYCRHIMISADFFNSIPEYHDLSHIDKIKLFQQSYCNYLMFSVYYEKWKYNMPCFAKQRPARFCMSDEEKERMSGFLKKMSLCADEFIYPLFSEINLSNLECVMLKVISAFFAPVDFTSGTQNKIFSIKTSYCTLLGRLIDELYPHLTPEWKISRFQRLMEATTKIREISNIFSELHACMTSYGQLAGTLSFDTHIRHFGDELLYDSFNNLNFK